MSNFVPPGPLPPPTPPPPRPLSDRPLPSFPPPPAIKPILPRKRSTWTRSVAIALGAMMTVLALIFAVLVVGRGDASRLDERAIVRVIAGHTSGTGFFVKAPKGVDGVLVVTAYHVVGSGEPAIVERLVSTSGDDSYLEAFPETEILAFDADSDLAILRVSHLPASLVSTMDLCLDVVKGAPVVSAGFPEGSITQRVSLIKKEGKLLEQTRLPVIDRAHGGVVREGVTPGILVSNDLEPGLGGGPTCDDRGRVLGVNMPNDERHRGQNGAVAASEVKALLDRIQLRTPSEGRRR